MRGTVIESGERWAEAVGRPPRPEMEAIPKITKKTFNTEKSSSSVAMDFYRLKAMISPSGPWNASTASAFAVVRTICVAYHIMYNTRRLSIRTIAIPSESHIPVCTCAPFPSQPPPASWHRSLQPGCAEWASPVDTACRNFLGLGRRCIYPSAKSVTNLMSTWVRWRVGWHSTETKKGESEVRI